MLLSACTLCHRLASLLSSKKYAIQSREKAIVDWVPRLAHLLARLKATSPIRKHLEVKYECAALIHKEISLTMLKTCKGTDRREGTAHSHTRN